MKKNDLKHNGLTWKLFLVIVLTDILNSVGQLFMKKGLLHVGIDAIGWSNLQEFLGKSALSPWVWLGIGFYVLNFFLWIFVLSRVDLSVAAPVGSTNYIFVPLLAIFFLGENVSPLHWLGIVLIIAGICLVSKSGGGAVIARSEGPGQSPGSSMGLIP